MRLWAAHEPFLADEFAPLHVLALHADSGGVLHLRDTKLSSLADLAGKRIRTPAGPITEAIAAVGAEPVHLLPPAIGKAAADGAIDGAIMAWDVLAYTQTHTIFHHHYLDVFYVSPLYLVMNPDSRARLSEAERRALDAASGADLARRFGDYWQAWSAPGRALAEAPGHTLEPLPPFDIGRFTRRRNSEHCTSCRPHRCRGRPRRRAGGLRYLLRATDARLAARTTAKELAIPHDPTGDEALRGNLANDARPAHRRGYAPDVMLSFMAGLANDKIANGGASPLARPRTRRGRPFVTGPEPGPRRGSPLIQVTGFTVRLLEQVREHALRMDTAER